MTDRPDHLALEECAVLGLFPLSSSGLLQDYDGLIATLSTGAAPATTLAGAVALLPVELQEAIGAAAPSAVVNVPDAVGVPALSADPSRGKISAPASKATPPAGGTGSPIKCAPRVDADGDSTKTRAWLK